MTAEYAVTERFAVSASYGEGFRSLDAASLVDGADRPYSKVRSVEAGMRADDGRRRYRTTLAVFNTWVENELVFVAESGGFETQSRSTRRGVVGSFLAKPSRWLLASTALSVTEAVFETNVPNISHHVPSVPPLLLANRRHGARRGRDAWTTSRSRLAPASATRCSPRAT